MQKICIAMMSRSCTTVRFWAIALIYYFKVDGSWRPGGIMVSVIFLGVMLLEYLLCCTVFLLVIFVRFFFQRVTESNLLHT
jgi:hypothetical protein